MRKTYEHQTRPGCNLTNQIAKNISLLLEDIWPLNLSGCLFWTFCFCCSNGKSSFNSFENVALFWICHALINSLPCMSLNYSMAYLEPSQISAIKFSAKVVVIFSLYEMVKILGFIESIRISTNRCLVTATTYYATSLQYNNFFVWRRKHLFFAFCHISLTNNWRNNIYYFIVWIEHSNSIFWRSSFLSETIRKNFNGDWFWDTWLILKCFH